MDYKLGGRGAAMPHVQSSLIVLILIITDVQIAIKPYEDAFVYRPRPASDSSTAVVTEVLEVRVLGTSEGWKRGEGTYCSQRVHRCFVCMKDNGSIFDII